VIDRPGTTRAPSLLGRVFLRMSLTMLAAVALVVTVLYFEFRDHMDSMRDRSLSGQAADIARHTMIDERGGVSVALPAALATVYDTETGRYRYAVLDRAGHLLAGSPGVTGRLDLDAVAFDRMARYFESLDAGTGRRFYGASISAHQDSVVIQVQQSADHADVVMDSFLDELSEEAIWIVVLVFVAILLVTYWTLRASLASLAAVSRQAAAIGPESLDKRLSLDGVPVEARPMVEAINAALDRVAGAFDQQRRFTADAAHEMRTPIAVLRAHMDTLDSADARALRRDLTALDRVVAQLLKLAQVDSLDIRPGSDADLHQVAVHVAALMGPAAIASGRSIAISGDAHVIVTGDADALEVALRNLVENALNHTAPDSEVEIALSAAHREVRVLDRGPGVDQADCAHVFERFWRRAGGDGNGAGLGLSIVARIAAAHGARVRVAARDGGGAVFSMRFPA
jgi:signal transduction histidine kinase